MRFPRSARRSANTRLPLVSGVTAPVILVDPCNSPTRDWSVEEVASPAGGPAFGDAQQASRASSGCETQHGCETQRGMAIGDSSGGVVQQQGGGLTSVPPTSSARTLRVPRKAFASLRTTLCTLPAVTALLAILAVAVFADVRLGVHGSSPTSFSSDGFGVRVPLHLSPPTTAQQGTQGRMAVPTPETSAPPESKTSGTSHPTPTTPPAATTPAPVQETPAPPVTAPPHSSIQQLGAEALSLVRYPWQQLPGYSIRFEPSSDAPVPGFKGNTTFTWGQPGGVSVLYVSPGESVTELAGITAFEIAHEVDASIVEPRGGHAAIENILGLHPASWAPNCDCAEQGFLSGWYAAAFSAYWSPGVGQWSTVAPLPSGAELSALLPWLSPPIP